MNTGKLTNTIVRSAIEAWQNEDAEAWGSFFVPGATLYDDGNLRNLAHFSKEAIGHERFTSIDKVEK